MVKLSSLEVKEERGEGFLEIIKVMVKNINWGVYSYN